MSARSRRRVTALRNVTTAPQRKVNIVLRLLVLLGVCTFAIAGGVAVAGYNYYNSVHYAVNPCSFICAQNSLIMTDNRKLLYEMVNSSFGSKVLKPLELNPQNHKQCPQGKQTHRKKFFFKFGSRYVPYLTCNGWGIPLKLQNATIATEDPTFYSNPGFDPFSIARAAFQDLTSGQIQSGASTLSQQLAKEFILRDTAPTITRKLKEIVVAFRLSQTYPKRFILYLYLNAVYYGHLAYGVQAASESYFHVDVSKIKLWQAATLAGLPQSPSFYDPFQSQTYSQTGKYPAWESRMLEVLNFLHERGYITQRQETAAEHKASRFSFHQSLAQIKQPDFVSYVIGQFQDMTNPNDPAFDRYLVQRLGHRRLNSGLKIITTLRPNLQAQAEADVHNQVVALNNPVDFASDGALVSINLRKGCYGCVMAMVGTANVDPKTTDINMADTPRQPGSSIKVFNYVSAFSKGLTPGTTVEDAPLEIPLGTIPQTYYSPANYSQTFSYRAVTLRDALDNSLNTPAVRVEIWNGPQTVANTAYKFGVTDFFHDNPHCCRGLWATTLGGIGGGMRLVQETAAYGVFATGGIKVPPISFTRIIDRATGRVLWRYSRDPVLRARRIRVASRADTYMISSILSDNQTRALEFGYDSPLNLYPYTAAAKTGTTSSFKDNWTEGYTPQIVTGVWVGNANDDAMGLGVNGITGAAPIWHDFMLQAFSTLHLQNPGFTQPPGMVAPTTCINQPYTTSVPYTSYFVQPADPAGVPANEPRLYCQVPATIGLDAATVAPPPVVTQVVVPTPTPVTQLPPSLLPGQ